MKNSIKEKKRIGYKNANSWRIFSEKVSGQYLSSLETFLEHFAPRNERDRWTKLVAPVQYIQCVVLSGRKKWDEENIEKE